MSTSFVSIGGRGFWVRDSLLEIWLRLAALHLDDPTDLPDPLQALRDEWLLASRGYFSGCNLINLDGLAATEGGRAAAVAAAQSLQAALSKAPATLAPDVLNLMGMSGKFTGMVETWRLRDLGAAFLDVLGPNIRTREAASAAQPGSGDSALYAELVD